MTDDTLADAIGISGYAGIGINVRDIEVTRRFYREGLGLREFLILPPQPGSDIPVEVVFTRTGGRDDGGILTTAGITEIGALYPPLVAATGPQGFGRLTSSTKCGPELFAKLRSAGYDITDFSNAADVGQGDTFGEAIITHDPDGYVVEIYAGNVNLLDPGLRQQTTNSAPALIDRFCGLVLFVRDLERSYRFYTEMLNMKAYRRIAANHGASERIVMTASGALNGGVLVLDNRPPEHQRDRAGFGRILALTADPAAAVARLVAAGYAGECMQSPSPDVVRFVTDPDGFTVELAADFISC